MKPMCIHYKQRVRNGRWTENEMSFSTFVGYIDDSKDWECEYRILGMILFLAGWLHKDKEKMNKKNEP